jgi:hypothetical protein
MAARAAARHRLYENEAIATSASKSFVLLLFYFRPSAGGPSIPAAILAKRLILPMKIVIGF